MTKKSKKSEKVEPLKDTLSLHVLYTQTSTGGESKSNEPYSGRTDEHTTTTFKGAIVGKYPTYSNWSHETFEVPKEAFAAPRSHVYAVVGYYSDGDTFGHSYDNMHIVDVYGNIEKANAVAKSLETESKEKHESIFGSKMRVPWGGYFSHLDRIDIEILSLMGAEVNYTDLGDQDPNDIPSW